MTKKHTHFVVILLLLLAVLTGVTQFSGGTWRHLVVMCQSLHHLPKGCTWACDARCWTPRSLWDLFPLEIDLSRSVLFIWGGRVQRWGIYQCFETHGVNSGTELFFFFFSWNLVWVVEAPRHLSPEGHTGVPGKEAAVEETVVTTQLWTLSQLSHPNQTRNWITNEPLWMSVWPLMTVLSKGLRPIHIRSEPWAQSTAGCGPKPQTHTHNRNFFPVILVPILLALGWLEDVAAFWMKKICGDSIKATQVIEICLKIASLLLPSATSTSPN